MKKLICFLLLILLLVLFLCFMDWDPILKLDTAEKVAEVYYANEAYFNAAATALLRYDEKVPRISISRVEEPVKTDAKYGKEINGLYIDSEILLTDSDYQELSEAIAPLMAKFPASGLAMYYSRVEFVLEGPTYGMAAELYCFQDEDSTERFISQSNGNYDCIMINPNWVAEIWHD